MKFDFENMRLINFWRRRYLHEKLYSSSKYFIIKSVKKLKLYLIMMSQTSLDESKFSIKTSLTLFSGRCYTIKLADGFLNYDLVLQIKLNSPYKLTAFAHEPGFEFWTHVNLYPEKPKIVTIGNNEDGYADILIKRSDYIKVNKKSKIYVTLS